MIKLTGKNISLIGMVHVRALPGTPRNQMTIREIRQTAVQEAQQLRKAGFDALLLENMHDVPYLKKMAGPEIIAGMSSVALSVREAVDCPIGVQILAGANREALAAAQAAGAQFIRAEGFVFAHVADEGFLESDAGALLRYRRMIGAEDIRIFADIKKKHSSHAITSDVNLEATARSAEFFGADALVITGFATGSPTSMQDLIEARQGTSLPLVVGSGAAPENLGELWHHAQAFIVGSYLKKNGQWDQPLDMERINRFIEASKKL